MMDEDLNALHAMLLRMDSDAQIDIGNFRCCASELLKPIGEAMAYRTYKADYWTAQARQGAAWKNP